MNRGLAVAFTVAVLLLAAGAISAILFSDSQRNEICMAINQDRAVVQGILRNARNLALRGSTPGLSREEVSRFYRRSIKKLEPLDCEEGDDVPLIGTEPEKKRQRPAQGTQESASQPASSVAVAPGRQPETRPQRPVEPEQPPRRGNPPPTLAPPPPACADGILCVPVPTVPAVKVEIRP